MKNKFKKKNIFEMNQNIYIHKLKYKLKILNYLMI